MKKRARDAAENSRAESTITTTTTTTMYVYMYVCMVTHIEGKVSVDQPVKVAIPARGQLNRGNVISLSVFAPEKLVSRHGFGSPVPRQPANLHTQAGSVQ